MHVCILIQVERGHQRCQSEVLSDFCDGSYYRSHQLFSTHADALQMMLYYDDIEVCNPLGSHTKTHKLGKVNVYSFYNTYLASHRVVCTIHYLCSMSAKLSCITTFYMHFHTFSCRYLLLSAWQS